MRFLGLTAARHRAENLSTATLSGHRSGLAQLYAAQSEGERHGHKGNQHQHPEAVHIGQVRRLCLHLLPYPGNRPLLRVEERAAMRNEIVRHLLQRILVLNARGSRMLDEPALVKLFAMRHHVGDERNADRSAGIAGRIDQSRRLISLVARDADVGRSHDRHENQW